MPWKRCNKCGCLVLIPRKLKHNNKRSIRCPNPNCGAYALLKIRNGHVKGLKHGFIQYFPSL